MMRKFKIIILLMAVVTVLSGCREAERASYNLSKEADSFGVCRRITVVNLRTDSVLYTFEGFSSISTDSDNDLNIVSCVGEGKYKKDFIHISNEITYVIQDISGANVSPYHYKWTIYASDFINPIDVDIDVNGLID